MMKRCAGFTGLLTMGASEMWRPTLLSDSRLPQGKHAAESICRNSQTGFARPTQTCIIFDWDDTLFPTTYVRDILRINWQLPVEQQLLPRKLKQDILAGLAKLSTRVVRILRLADSLGK